MQSLEHLTLLTGNTRSSPRNEVAQDVINILRPSVFLGSGKLGDTGWSLRMVKGPITGSCGFTLSYHDKWLLSCYMAWTKEADMPMWQTVKQLAGTFGQNKAKKPKRLPWLAVAMMPEALSVSPFVMLEAGDLERCVAWTVLDTFSAQAVA